MLLVERTVSFVFCSMIMMVGFGISIQIKPPQPPPPPSPSLPINALASEKNIYSITVFDKKQKKNGKLTARSETK